MTRFILHIGDGKCGSSAIQTGLYHAMAELEERGILYRSANPSSGNLNLITLLGLKTRGDDGAQQELARGTLAELKARMSSAKYVLISAEPFLTLGPASVERILRLISEEIESIDAIAYLREPAAMYLALVQQSLKASAGYPPPDRHRREVDQHLALWQAHPLVRSLRVRLFERDTLVKGSVVADFESLLGQITQGPVPALTDTEANASLTAEQMVVLQDLRRTVCADRDGKDANESNWLQILFHTMNRDVLIGRKATLTHEVQLMIAKNNADIVSRLNARYPTLCMTQPALTSAPLRPSRASWNDVADLLQSHDPVLVERLKMLVPHFNKSLRKGLSPQTNAAVESILAMSGRHESVLAALRTYWKRESCIAAQRALRAPEATTTALPSVAKPGDGSEKNKYARWVGPPTAAAQRLAARVVVPQAPTSFQLTPESRVFAIGSCFARNVEERLALAGATVLSRSFDIKNLGDQSARATGIFNKYSPAAIYQELAITTGVLPTTDSLYLETERGAFYDGQLRANSGVGSVADLSERRRDIQRYFQQSLKADLVIITLGLTEVWWDASSGLCLNEAPHPRSVRREPKRFQFNPLSFEQCLYYLELTYGLLRARGNPNAKLVVTVSPVPLGRTFTDHDVFIANSISKNTLYVAARRFVDNHPEVDYFPSFEAVTLSDRGVAWQEDQLHVSDFMVGRVIGTFLERYGLGAPGDAGEMPEAAAPGPSTDRELIAAMKNDIDRYKNQIIRLESQMMRANGRPGT